MQIESPLVRFGVLLLLAVVGSGFAVAHRLRAGPPLSRAGCILAAAPTLVFLVLFYSLALHMRWSLGTWPASIGDQGFPPALVFHENLSMRYAWGLFVASTLLWPITLATCLLVGRGRRYVAYLGIHALSFAVGIGLMLLAPARFLNWWWD